MYKGSNVVHVYNNVVIKLKVKSAILIKSPPSKMAKNGPLSASGHSRAPLACFKFYIDLWKTMYGVKALNEIYAFI